MNQATSSPISERSKKDSWKIILSILCIVIIAYGILFSKNTSESFYFLLGFMFPWALFIWGIFYALVGKGKGAQRGGFAFFAIIICLVVSGYLGVLRQKHEATLAISQVQQVYSKIIESSTDTEGHPKRITSHIETNPVASGLFGEMEEHVKELISQMVSQRNDYLLELEAIGWSKILDVNRLKTDQTLAESKYIIRKAKQIVHKYSDKSFLLLKNGRDKINSYNVNEYDKKELLVGYDQSMEESNKVVQSIWTLCKSSK
ncbi:MAG: hypothetical protein HOF96_03875 [Candidatus Marinimicrobia bacterium]|jgi:hypothetical protein|nr:hypothetical protein [Candidatus Neomarinimicrobiota bacterium]